MMGTQDVSFRLKLRDIIEDLNCGGDKSLDITIIPVEGNNTIVNSVGINVL
jgi:hypothetical protein